MLNCSLRQDSIIFLYYCATEECEIWPNSSIFLILYNIVQMIRGYIKIYHSDVSNVKLVHYDKIHKIDFVVINIEFFSITV